MRNANVISTSTDGATLWCLISEGMLVVSCKVSLVFCPCPIFRRVVYGTSCLWDVGSSTSSKDDMSFGY